MRIKNISPSGQVCIQHLLYVISIIDNIVTTYDINTVFLKILLHFTSVNVFQLVDMRLLIICIILLLTYFSYSQFIVVIYRFIVVHFDFVRVSSLWIKTNKTKIWEDIIYVIFVFQRVFYNNKSEIQLVLGVFTGRGYVSMSLS